MADPPEDSPVTPPRTLQDSPLDPGNPANSKTIVASRQARVDSLQAQFDQYVVDQLHAGNGVVVKSTGVYAPGGKSDVPPKPANSTLSDEEWAKYSGGDSTKETMDTVGSGLMAELEQAKNELDVAQRQAKDAKAALPAVESYLTSEENKTGEISRQFKDFAARADEYEQLRNAEAQNVQNVQDYNKSQLDQHDKYGVPLALDTPYGYGQNLSHILRPSLPDYVRPDYRLNGAVGLPGAEGFDDPNYDANGMPLRDANGVPMYAEGTEDPLAIFRQPGIRPPIQLMPAPKVWPYRPRGIAGVVPQ